MQEKILLVDDDPDILEFLGYNLKQNGYLVELAENGTEAIEKMKQFVPDLVILDVMMPEMDGIETCQEIRKNKNYDNVIVTFLTARGEDYSQIAGFESGADDYITKPIKPKLLISKIKSLLRRKDVDLKGGPIEIPPKIRIDKDKYAVIVEGEEVFLPKKEFEILTLLASKPDIVVTRDEIYEKIWGDKIYVGDRTIDVHIRKIRQKIGEDIIKTVKGIGYKLQITDL